MTDDDRDEMPDFAIRETNVLADYKSSTMFLFGVLEDALQLAEEGWAYASPYFREKHDCEARIRELQDLLIHMQAAAEGTP